MKKFIYLFNITLVSILLFNGCYDDKEETLYRFSQSNNCDTTNVTFSLTIAPIIQSNCASCHSGASASANLSLQNYTEITTAVNSRGLYERISNSANPMPPGGLMDACKIKQVKKWIDSGLLNN